MRSASDPSVEKSLCASSSVGKRSTPTRIFDLDPERFFLNDKALDYAIVVVKPTGIDGAPLSQFRFLPLIGAKGKIRKGDSADIIHITGGGMRIWDWLRGAGAGESESVGLDPGGIPVDRLSTQQRMQWEALRATEAPRQRAPAQPVARPDDAKRLRDELREFIARRKRSRSDVTGRFHIKVPDELIAEIERRGARSVRLRWGKTKDIMILQLLRNDAANGKDDVIVEIEIAVKLRASNPPDDDGPDARHDNDERIRRGQRDRQARSKRPLEIRRVEDRFTLELPTRNAPVQMRDEAGQNQGEVMRKLWHPIAKKKDEPLRVEFARLEARKQKARRQEAPEEK